MSSLVGGTRIIGQDYVVGFRKKFPMKITKWYDGFINIKTGEIEYNISYPNAIYSDFVKVDKEKNYTIDFDKEQGSTNSVRIRVYDTNKKIILDEKGVGIGITGIMLPLASYVLKKYSIAYIRIMFLNKNVVDENTTVIKEV